MMELETEAVPAAPRRSWLRRLYDWVLHWADTPYGVPARGLLAFAESSVFPIPPDPLLMALSVARPRRALFYAGVCSLASVLGGIAGYALGHFLWLEVRGFFFAYVFSEAVFERVGTLYDRNAFVAVLTAGLTPIPYKVFTVAAGVFQIAIGPFVAASVIGRSTRFLIEAGLVFRFGPAVRRRIEANFDAYAMSFMVLLILGFVAVKLVV